MSKKQPQIMCPCCPKSYLVGIGIESHIRQVHGEGALKEWKEGTTPLPAVGSLPAVVAGSTAPAIEIATGKHNGMNAALKISVGPTQIAYLSRCLHCDGFLLLMMNGEAHHEKSEKQVLNYLFFSSDQLQKQWGVALDRADRADARRAPAGVLS